MDSKPLHNLKKKILPSFLLIALIGSTFYAPVFAPRAQAVAGVEDTVHDILLEITNAKQWMREVADGIAMAAAQTMIDQMVKSTVTWANTGFEGGPAYVTNPKRYYTHIADGVAGEFIEGRDLGFLCSPFQANIKIALAREYYQPPETQFQCTLTKVVKDINGFTHDFNKGGWDAWFAMTQNPTNNVFGAYTTASIKLNNKIENALSLSEQDMQMNQGYLSTKECLAYNPDQATLDTIRRGIESGLSKEDYRKQTNFDLSKPAGACIQDGPIVTAGATVKAGLDKVLPSGLEKLVTLQHAEQLVGAFASGLLQRYVFGPRGLIGKNYGDTYSSSSGGTSTYMPPLIVECLADTDIATVSDTKVTFTALTNLDTNDIDYTWSGEGLDNATSSRKASVVYYTSGVKSATVTASTTDANGNHLERTAACPKITVSNSS